MPNLKHIGRMIKTKRKVVVAYRVVPDDPENCIVVTTENLAADEHDTLMKLVESPAGQQANELADAMARARLPDGRIMLAAFHKTGKMVKVPAASVEMTPNRNTVIVLSELNQMIATQKGVTVADLAVKPNSKNTDVEEVKTGKVVETVETTHEQLSPEELASKMRSQADSMFKEAKRLREMAEEIVPTKKKTTKTEESA
jgi:translation elongation factor EF-1beta